MPTDLWILLKGIGLGLAAFGLSLAPVNWWLVPDLGVLALGWFLARHGLRAGGLAVLGYILSYGLLLRPSWGLWVMGYAAGVLIWLGLGLAIQGFWRSFIFSVVVISLVNALSWWLALNLAGQGREAFVYYLFQATLTVSTALIITLGRHGFQKKQII